MSVRRVATAATMTGRYSRRCTPVWHLGWIRHAVTLLCVLILLSGGALVTVDALDYLYDDAVLWKSENEVEAATTGIDGGIIIDGCGDCVDLALLAGLVAINGDLYLANSPSLTSLNGLNSVVNITGSITLLNLPALSSLSALASLQRIATAPTDSAVLLRPVRLQTLPALESLAGLENVERMGCYDPLDCYAQLSLSYTAVQSLTGLSSLTVLDQLYLYECANITSLSGIPLLTSLRSVNVNTCFSLESYNGLGNVTTAGDGSGSWVFNNNPLVTSMAGVKVTAVGSFLLERQGSMSSIAPWTLESVAGDFSLKSMEILTDISPLGGVLSSVGGAMVLQDMPLASLAAVHGIQPAALTIRGLTNVASIAPLNAITEIESIEVIDMGLLSALDGLHNLVNITDSLTISDNALLLGLDELVDLKHVDGAVKVERCGNLTNIDAFHALEHIGSLRLHELAALTSISGLSNLLEIGGLLELGQLPLLESLSPGFASLGTVGNVYIDDLLALADIRSLNNIQGSIDSFYVARCPSMATLSGLNGVSQITGELQVNTMLALEQLNAEDAPFTHLSHVGALYIGYTPLLRSLEPLSMLTDISEPGTITINSGGAALNNLDGLRNLVSNKASPINMYLSANENLTSIGTEDWKLDEFGALTVQLCPRLTSLAGLGNVQSIDGDLIVSSNLALRSLGGLHEVAAVGGNVNILSNDELASLSLDSLGTVGNILVSANPQVCCHDFDPVALAGTYAVIDCPCPKAQCPTTCANGDCDPVTLACDCDSGWMGEFCDVVFVDACGNLCANGTCVDATTITGNSTCQCDNGWTGEHCDVSTVGMCSPLCQQGYCIPNGVVTGGGRTGTCVCDIGYSGPACNLVDDPCDPDPCGEHGQCSADCEGGTCWAGYYECECDLGWTGVHCNECTLSCSGDNTTSATSVTEAISSSESIGSSTDSSTDSKAAGGSDNGSSGSLLLAIGAAAGAVGVASVLACCFVGFARRRQKSDKGSDDAHRNAPYLEGASTAGVIGSEYRRAPAEFAKVDGRRQVGSVELQALNFDGSSEHEFASSNESLSTDGGGIYSELVGLNDEASPNALKYDASTMAVTKEAFMVPLTRQRDGTSGGDAMGVIKGVFSLNATQIPFAELVFEEVLGEGQFGVVSKGTWRRSKVAIKRMKLDQFGATANAMDSDELAEFAAEATLMSSLRPHSNCVTFYGTSLDVEWCIVLEYCSGGTLLAFLRDSASVLTQRVAIHFALDIAAGLSHLHSEKIVHRDVAARNVLLTGVENKAKIADYGMSRQLSARKEYGKTQASIGPIRWMAPEALSQRFSAASDVWSFGATMIEVLTRQQPYPEHSPIEVARFVARGELKPTVPASTPSALAVIIEHCFANDPQGRPTMHDVVLGLHALLDADAAMPSSS